MPRKRSAQKLLAYFKSKTVADLSSLQAALENASAVTVFRYLKQLSYRRSYNHNGRFYALHDPSRYDELGLWSFEGIHFSVDGSLKNTVQRLVYESAAGFYHFELQRRLQVRAHNTILDLLSNRAIGREEIGGHYLYVHTDPQLRASQLKSRQELLAAQRFELQVTDSVVIQVLLVLIRYPGSRVGDVARRLKGHSPPITLQHVRVVFDRYDLDEVGEKGGSSKR